MMSGSASACTARRSVDGRRGAPLPREANPASELRNGIRTLKLAAAVRCSSRRAAPAACTTASTRSAM